MNNELLSRITIDPEICHGKPVVRGIRYPVETQCIASLPEGMAPLRIIDASRMLVFP